MPAIFFREILFSCSTGRPIRCYPTLRHRAPPPARLQAGHGETPGHTVRAVAAAEGTGTRGCQPQENASRHVTSYHSLYIGRLRFFQS